MMGSRVVLLLVLSYLTGIQGQDETTTEAPSKYLIDLIIVQMLTSLFL